MPEPILVAIAAALAGKGVTSMYDFVRSRLGLRGRQALEAAQGSEPDAPEVHALADALHHAEQEDPQFRTELRTLWGQVAVQQHADHGGVTNQITGNVTGKVLQARDVEGGVRF